MTAINVFVFVAWQLAVLGGPDRTAFMEAHFLVSVDHLRAGSLWTLLTSEFSHISPPHLFFNLLALWVFGADLERLLGARAFAHLYVAGAIAASAGHVLYGLATGVTTPALGASGAAMAIAVVSALVYPNRMLLLFFVIPLPAWAAISLFVAIDLFGLLAPGEMIAHAAHLGGAAYGWFYHRRTLSPYLIGRLEAVGVQRVVGRATRGL